MNRSERSLAQRAQVSSTIALGTMVHHEIERRLTAPRLSVRAIDPPSSATQLACPQLKQLSVKDPWIGLLGNGTKRYELRTRATPYRGLVVLCSSVTPSRTPDAMAARVKHPQATPAPLGFALYLGELVNCRPAVPADEAWACCLPMPNEYAWEFANVRALATPIPIKGQLGLTSAHEAVRTSTIVRDLIAQFQEAWPATKGAK